MKKSLILGVLFLVSVFLVPGNSYAQEPMDYNQLMAQCSAALKEVRSYNVTIGRESTSTINSKETKGDSVELKISFVAPDKFKVSQAVNELWDGWIILGDDYYEFSPNPPEVGQDLNSYRPTMSWVKKDNDLGRMNLCKNNSPEGVLKLLETLETEYKRDSITLATQDGTEYFVIKYSMGKESVETENLPPELKNGQVKGSYEVWINKDTYLPLKQTEEISYYSNEENKASSSSKITYASYNDDQIKIDEPQLGSQVF